MSTYTLSGSGIQAISSNVGALHIHFPSAPSSSAFGLANPPNYYGLGLLRAGDATAWFPAKPIEALDQWFPLPTGTTRIAYSFFGGLSVTVTEVAGASPLDGPNPLISTLGDVALTGLTNKDFLRWDSSTSKWENVQLGQTVTSFVSSDLAANISITGAGTYTDGPSLSLAAGTWLIIARCTIQNGLTAGCQATVKMWDGITVFASGESGSGQSFRMVITLVQKVVLSTLTTVKCSAAMSVSGGTPQWLAATLSNGSPTKATGMVALAIG